MGKPFPELSKEPIPNSWTEELLIDPTIRSEFGSGVILTRARFTSLAFTRIRFNYRLLTLADKLLLENHQEAVKVGASKFTFRNPITDEEWEVRYLSPISIGVESELFNGYRAKIDIFGKQVKKMRQTIIRIEDLGAGVDITDRPVFVAPQAVTINSIGILTEGSPAGVDDANTAVILLEDDASNAIVTKTYNTGIQPPSSDYEDLGNLDNASLAAGEHIMLSVTQGTTANLPALSIIIEYYYT